MASVGVYMLDVGQGDATVVLLPNPKHCVLFDCRDAHVATRVLEHWKVERLDVVVSHLDMDHIAGVAEVLNHFRERIVSVFLSADRPLTDADENVATARRVVDTARADDRPWRLYDAKAMPTPIVAEDGCAVSLVAPENDVALDEARSGGWEDANRHSAVLRVEYGGKAVLVGGDAPLVTWAGVPEAQRRADVFRTPHHGGALDDGGVPADWDVARLYEEVAAPDAVISVGTRNGHHHPNPTWTAPLLRGACSLRCTQVTRRCEPSVDQEADSLRSIVVPKNNVTASHHAEPPWRHLTQKRFQRSKFDEVPCAGTVVVKLEDTGAVQIHPTRAVLDPVIQLWSHPLCRPEP